MRCADFMEKKKTEPIEIEETDVTKILASVFSIH